MLIYSNQVMILVLVSILSVANAQQLRQDLVTHPHWNQVSKFQEDCGENVADRIIGGVNASLGQYPWIARLGYSYELMPGELTVDSYECGGAIISDRYILSAAHCSSEVVGTKLVQIRLGEYYTETDPDCVNGVCAPPVQDIEVESTKCHEKYNKKNFQNDICLIRLAKPIEFNNFVQPICLPVYDTFLTQSFEKKIMEVAGWGIYDLGISQLHTILQTLKVPVTNHDSCKLKYTEKVEITDFQFCAGGVIGQDSCSGDSGGAIMAPFSFNAPPKYFVVGVVSFGPQRCAETDSPGIYTKVAAYMKWILDNIKP